MEHCIMMFILCIMTIVCLAEDRYIEQRCDKCNNELVKCSMCKGRGYDLSNRQCKNPIKVNVGSKQQVESHISG